MSITDYIHASRRTRPTTLRPFYEACYEELTKHAPHITHFPTLFISYSSDRRPEFVQFSDTDYLVYDQYLGQSLNVINRILLAEHSWELLTLSYASKYLAEQLVTRGDLPRAAVFAGSYQVFLEQARTRSDPYDVSPEIFEHRAALTYVQECFSIAHELAHYIINTQRDKCQADMQSIEADLNDHLTQEISAEALQAASLRYGEEFARKLKDNVTEVRRHQRRVFESYKSELMVEMLCDRYACRMTEGIIRNAPEISPEVIAEGIVLLTRYLRLLAHLDELAKCLVTLRADVAPSLRAQTLQSLHRSIWGHGDSSLIIRTQLRETPLRYEMYRLFHANDPEGVESLQSYLADSTDNYDERIESVVARQLIGRICDTEQKVDLSEASDESADREQMIRIIDEMVGWIQAPVPEQPQTDG